MGHREWVIRSLHPPSHVLLRFKVTKSGQFSAAAAAVAPAVAGASRVLFLHADTVLYIERVLVMSLITDPVAVLGWMELGGLPF